MKEIQTANHLTDNKTTGFLQLKNPVISEYLKNIYIKDTKSKNVEIIYSSLDYDQYFNFKKTQTLNILSEKKFTVLNIGSFNKNKNQLFLLEALKSISCVNDFKVKMFGRVADKKYFKKVLNNIENVMCQISNHLPL